MVYPFSEDKLGQMTYFHKRKTQTMTRTQAVLVQKLSKAVNVWKDLWYRSKFAELPSLYFESIHAVIDTRIERKKILLNKLEYKILSQLNNPMTLQDLQKINSLQDWDVLVNSIKKFEENDLLFSENGRYMSLVTDSAGQAPNRNES